MPKRIFQYKFNASVSRIDPDWRETGTNYRDTDMNMRQSEDNIDSDSCVWTSVGARLTNTNNT